MPNPVRSKIRELIKAEELINKLQNSILDPKQEALGQNEVNCIKILLNKTLPDLKALEHSGEISGNLTHNLIQVEYIASNKDTDS